MDDRNYLPYALVTDGTIGASIVFRVPAIAGGSGTDGLAPVPKLTDPAGANVTLTLNTHYTVTGLPNVTGDYELRIALTRFAALGVYTIGIASGDPAVGDDIYHLALVDPYFRVNDVAPTASSFVIAALNGPALSATTDFYKDGFLTPITGALSTCGPKRVTAFNGGTGGITVNAFPAAPANNDILLFVRR